MLSIINWLTVEESVELSEEEILKETLKQKGLLSEALAVNPGVKAVADIEKAPKKVETMEGGDYKDLGKEIGKNIKGRNAMLAAAAGVGEGGDYTDFGKEIGKDIRSRNQALKDALGEGGCGSSKASKWMKK